MQALARPPIPVVVMQHAQESAFLRHVRSVLVRAPHVKLHQLQRLDERIAAHLDGLAVAGRFGAECCAEALVNPGAGEVFAAAACAIEAHDNAGLERLIAVAGALPDAKRGLLSALGWVSAAQLKGIVSALLASTDSLRREFGIGACRLHHADPGAALTTALRDPAPSLRAEAVRCVGELGRIDLLPQILIVLAGPDEALKPQAAIAACLLGERDHALEWLAGAALGDGPSAAIALAFALHAAEFKRAQDLVRSLAKAGRDQPAQKRRLIRACGLLGDTHFVPWLIELMADDAMARLAGESFSMITGADLAALDLERKPPEGLETGPNDDALDDNVALDEDDNLPWPDAERAQRWWQAHATRMAAGTRLFVGSPPSPESLAGVLREGLQRQRIAAARLMSLMVHGTKLFATAAPAWRQMRRLKGAA